MKRLKTCISEPDTDSHKYLTETLQVCKRHAVEELLGLVLEACPATLEGIDQQIHRVAVEAHQEVVGKVHALERETQPPSDL